ncbi:MAG: hypothetical protein GY774_28865 [Planctomycetes bacterium]|nr:hypothetical protein [Planctomycetota bacterium]
MQRRLKLICYSLIPITLVGLACWFMWSSIGCLTEEYPAAEHPVAEHPAVEHPAVEYPPDEVETSPDPPQIPEFPWPPPKASATAEIPRNFLSSQPDDVLRLRDADEALKAALESCGHFEKSYYRVPKGFAMVTRLEQINQDGTSKEPPDRWAAETQPLRKFSLSKYLTALFSANPGYYRIIVFAVTKPFHQSDEIMNREEAMEWLRGGLNELPDSIGKIEYSEEHTCTALIYEFERPNPDEPAELKASSNLQGRTHLVKAGIWQALEN